MPRIVVFALLGKGTVVDRRRGMQPDERQSVVTCMRTAAEGEESYGISHDLDTISEDLPRHALTRQANCVVAAWGASCILLWLQRSLRDTRRTLPSWTCTLLDIGSSTQRR